MERDPLRPGFPMYEQRHRCVLNYTLLYQPAKITRRIDRCILDLLDGIAQGDTPGVRFQLCYR